MLNKNFFIKKQNVVGGGEAQIIIAPSGRKLYRHESDMGTVMEFNDGQDRKVIVLDAVYRGREIFGCSDYNPTKIPVTDGPAEYYQLGGTVTNSKTFTDDYLNTNMDIIDSLTSKQNCDIWMTFQEDAYEGLPAIEHCRSILINDIPCDLPNIQTLIRIYCDGDILDEMDPTVADNPRKALGLKNPTGAWSIDPTSSGMQYVWSSSKTNKTTCWTLSSQTGAVIFLDRSSSDGVIPVLEI